MYGMKLLPFPHLQCLQCPRETIIVAYFVENYSGRKYPSQLYLPVIAQPLFADKSAAIEKQLQSALLRNNSGTKQGK